MTLEQVLGIIILCLIITGFALTKAKDQYFSNDDVKNKKLKKGKRET